MSKVVEEGEEGAHGAKEVGDGDEVNGKAGVDRHAQAKRGIVAGNVVVTEANKLAPFNPTCDEAIAAALELARLTDDDTLLDVGCGDARLLVKAVEEVGGLQAEGIEYDRKFYERGLEAVRAAGVQDRVRLHHADALAMEWPAATVVFLYLTPTGVGRALHKLKKARDNGARVVASVFSVKGWEATDVRTVRGGMKVYLYDSR